MMRRTIVLLALLLVAVLVASTALAESGLAPTAQDATPTPQAEEEAAEEADTETADAEETEASETVEPAADDVTEAYLTLNLQAGYPLDPFLVSVNGGGAQAASDLDPACSGYINSAPTLTVDWEGETDLLEAFFYSDHDPVLVVQTPDGAYVCNDDANDQLLDPVVELTDVDTGLYHFWVGAYTPDDLIPGLLVLTTREEINVGSFSVANLVRRANIPEDLMEHEELAPARERLKAALEAVQEAGISLPAREEFVEGVTTEVSSEGDFPAFELPVEGAVCAGFISESPDYSFDLQTEGEHLRIFFEGDQDATLLVSTPDGTVLCKDDFILGENLNPLVDIPNPALGRYDVFVGRVNLEEPVTGELTIIESTDEMPDALEAETN